jgi:arabinofuranosyltransferase
VHWIDDVALSEPLLARMPAQWRPDWMTGHFVRTIPRGYVQTLETGENVIADPQVHELYDRISLVTRGDLWSMERFRAIWWLNTGGPEQLLNEEAWRYYGSSKRKPSSIGAGRVPDGTALDSKLVRPFADTGVYVKYKGRQHKREVELSVNDNDRFEIRFYDGPEEVARVQVPRQLEWNLDGISARRIELPQVLSERGFTRLRILPRTRNRGRNRPNFAVGHLLFDEEIEAALPVAPVKAEPAVKATPVAKTKPADQTKPAGQTQPTIRARSPSD